MSQGNPVKLQKSGTMDLFSRVVAMRAAGIEVISLGAGQLDDDTPEHVRDAGKRAIEDGHTRYTPSSGTFDLRQAICAKYKREWSADYEPNQVVVSNGAKHAIVNTLFATVGIGDEVIILAPYYPSYPAMIQLTGATAVVVQTDRESGCQPDPEAIERAVTEKSRAIIVNSPNNPTGAAYDPDTLTAIADIAIEHDLLIISDDIYEKIVFPPAKFESFLALGERIRDRLVIAGGVSKSYAMTGWRLGWAIGPEDIIERAGLVQSHMTSNASSISQRAAIAAIDGGDDFLRDILAQLTEKRKIATETLFEVKELTIEKTSGAFYLFPDLTPLLGRKAAAAGVASSYEFCRMLLEQYHVAVVPGEGFGAPGRIRISFSGEPTALETGCKKIVAALQSLK
jgi:aspartate aminotransferase